MSEQPKEPSQWAKHAVVKQSFPLSIGDIARLIDAATAQRDAEIERLKDELGMAFAERDAAVMAADKKDQRIAQLEALLESQRHNHNEISYYGRLANIESAKKLCLACQYEALKKEQP